MNCKYAIFDMDGTLIDSMDWWRHSAMECAQLRGITVPDNIAVKIQAMSCEDGVDYVNTRFAGSNKITLEDVICRMKYHYENDVSVKPGAVEFLERLRSRNTHMCVITATPREATMTALKVAQIEDYFDFVITPDDFPTGKDDPAVFMEAMRRFGSTAEQTALFEDSLYSIRTAKQIGLHIVAISDNYCIDSEDDLRQAADEYCDGFYPD